MSKALAAAGPVLAPTWRENFARRVSRGGDELTAIHSLAARRDVITFSGGFPAPETFPVDDVRELAATAYGWHSAGRRRRRSMKAFAASVLSSIGEAPRERAA